MMVEGTEAQNPMRDHNSHTNEGQRLACATSPTSSASPEKRLAHEACLKLSDV